MIRNQAMSRENVNSDYDVTHILLLFIENDKKILISFYSWNFTHQDKAKYSKNSKQIEFLWFVDEVSRRRIKTAKHCSSFMSQFCY
jgi:hypothetical protein